MKKFLLVAVAALAVVACKKDDDNNGGEQPAPQETNPYIVNFEYPKTIVTEEGTGVSTLTHTVTDRLLREVTYKNTLGANETISFSYNSENYLTKIEKKTPGVPTATLELFYNSKKQVERTLKTAPGEVVTTTFTYDAEGRIKGRVKDGHGTVFSSTYVYTGNQVVESTTLAHGGNYSKTYTFDNNSNVIKEESAGSTFTYTYTTGLNYNGRGAFRIVSSNFENLSAMRIGSLDYDKRFEHFSQKNFPKTNSMVAKYTYDNEAKPTQVVLKFADRTVTQTLTY